jgi:hypothetical protein
MEAFERIIYNNQKIITLIKSKKMSGGIRSMNDRNEKCIKQFSGKPNMEETTCQISL